MACNNARNGPQNERKNPQTSANLNKCSFENMNLGQLFIARAEIEDSGTNCVFEQKEKRAKIKYQWKVQVGYHHGSGQIIMIHRPKITKGTFIMGDVAHPGTGDIAFYSPN